MATRRALLGHFALGLGVLACRASIGQPAERAVYAGIETSAATGHSTASFFSVSGARLGGLRLDFRAHGMAQHGPRVVVFPRRPGTRFAVVDQDRLEIEAVVAAPADRHFYGHGAFTGDGRTLLVTENNLETLKGSIGIYDLAPDLRRVGEIPLGTAGPHEIIRHPARDQFFVALGGIETHPAYGRTPLNLGEFQSDIVSLTLDSSEPASIGDWPGSAGVSLRHLAMDGRGRLYVGGQREDPSRATAKSVVWIMDKGEVSVLTGPDRLQGYVSSVSAQGEEALVSSKEAGCALHLRGAEITEAVPLEGAGAVALAPGVTALSGFAALHLNDATVPVLSGHEFDNHGLALGQDVPRIPA